MSIGKTALSTRNKQPLKSFSKCRKIQYCEEGYNIANDL